MLLSVMSTNDTERNNNSNSLYDADKTTTTTSTVSCTNNFNPDTKECRVVMPKLNAQLDSHLNKKKTINLKWLKEIVAANLARQNVANNRGDDDVRMKNASINPPEHKSDREMTVTSIQPVTNCISGNSRHVWDGVSRYHNGDTTRIDVSNERSESANVVVVDEKKEEKPRANNDILSRVINEVFFEWEESDDDENNNEKNAQYSDNGVNLSYQVDLTEITCLLDDIVEQVVERVDKYDVESVVSDYMSLKLSSDNSDEEEDEKPDDSRLNQQFCSVQERNDSILDWLNIDKSPMHPPIDDDDDDNLPPPIWTDEKPKVEDEIDDNRSKCVDEDETPVVAGSERESDVINNVVYAIVNSCDAQQSTDGEIPKLRLTKEIHRVGEVKTTQKVSPLRLSLKEIQEANDSKTMSRIAKKFVRLSLDDDETKDESAKPKEKEKQSENVRNVFELKSDNNDKQIDRRSLPLLIYAKVDENHVIETVDCCPEDEQRRATQREERREIHEPAREGVSNDRVIDDDETDVDEHKTRDISAHTFDAMADELSRDFHFDVEDAEAFKASARELLAQNQSSVIGKRKRQSQHGRKQKRRQQQPPPSRTIDVYVDKQKDTIADVDETNCKSQQSEKEDNLQNDIVRDVDASVNNNRDNDDKDLPQSQINDKTRPADENHAANSHELTKTNAIPEDEYRPSTTDESTEDEDDDNEDDDDDDALWTRPNVATRNSKSVPDLEGMLTRMKSLRKRGGEDVADLKFDDPIPLEYKRRRRRRQLAMAKRKQHSPSEECRFSSVDSSNENSVSADSVVERNEETETIVDINPESSGRLIKLLTKDKTDDKDDKNNEEKLDSVETTDETPLDLSNKKTPTPTPTPVPDNSRDESEPTPVEDDSSLPKITNVISLADNNTLHNHTLELSNSYRIHPPHVVVRTKTPNAEIPKPTPTTTTTTSSSSLSTTTTTIATTPESQYAAFNNEQFQNEYRKLRRELATLDMVALQKEKERNNILRLKKYKQTVMQQLQIKRGLLNGRVPIPIPIPIPQPEAGRPSITPLPVSNCNSTINSTNSATVQPPKDDLARTATAKLSFATEVTHSYRARANPTVIRPIVTKAVRLAAPAPIRPNWSKDLKMVRPELLSGLSSIDTIVAKANDNFGLQTCWANGGAAQFQQRASITGDQVRPTIHVPIPTEQDLVQLQKDLERNLKNFSVDDLLLLYKQMLQQQQQQQQIAANNNNARHKLDQNGPVELILQPQQHLLIAQPMPVQIPQTAGKGTQQQHHHHPHHQQRATTVPTPIRPILPANERLPDCYRNSALAHLLTRQSTSNSFETASQVSNNTATTNNSSVTINDANDKRTTISHIDRKLIGRRWPTCHSCHQHMARYICAGCNQQWYCSEACQVVDWKTHFKSCRQ